MTPPEPTAAARAAALALVREIHMRHELFGSALPEIATALDAFRAQGVERAHAAWDIGHKFNETYIADLKLKLEQAEKERDALRARLSPGRLREVAMKITDTIFWPSAAAPVLAVLQRHFGK